MTAHDHVDELTGEHNHVASWRIVDEEVAEQRVLEDSEARFRKLAAAATDLIVEADEQLRRTWLSDSVSGLLGRDAVELLGADLLGLLAADDRPRVEALLEELAQQGGSRVLELRFETDAGGSRLMQAHVALVEDGSGRNYVVGAVDLGGGAGGDAKSGP